MKDTEVELLGFSEMPHTGHERLPERAVIGALRQDLVDGRVMEGWCAMGICRHGPALPWHPEQHLANLRRKVWLPQLKNASSIC